MRVFLLICMLGLSLSCRKTGPLAPPPADTAQAMLMILQPKPSVYPLDVYSVYMDTAKLNSQPVFWPGFTQYLPAPAGDRWLFVDKTGTFANYWVYPFYFRPGGHYTLYNIDQVKSGANNYAFVEDDLGAPPAGYAKIRWIQGRSLFYPDEDGPFSWIIHGGDTLAQNIGFRSSYPLTDPRYQPDTTGFKLLAPGSYVFDIVDTDAPFTFQTSLQTSLQAGGIYTLFTYGVPQPDSLLKTGVMLIRNK